MGTRRWTPKTRLDLAASIARFERWGGDPVNTVKDGVFSRVAVIEGRAIPYSARQLPGGAVEVRSDKDPDGALTDLKYRLADRLPVEPLRTLAARDPIIGNALRARPGYRPPMTRDLFESLVTSITAQQVNLTWATTTRRRLVERYGRRRRLSGGSIWQFPDAATLASADPAEIRAMQFTNAKAAYIINVAQAAGDGFDDLSEASNEEVVTSLTRIKGVGRWTAEWALARCLARPDAVAAGDLGVRKAVGNAYLGVIASEAEVREITTSWGDAANWAAHLLLEGLAD